ncbi:MAG: hypothetical protein PHG05_03430 [Candidatus Nanoarchaeia archaeon]|nr:hypothetical protein [Candidatus Nanoarchaeia archaeon]
MENSNFRKETLDFFLEQAPIMGDIALKYFGNLQPSDVEYKSTEQRDPVTIADKEISRAIVSKIKERFSDKFLLLTEETVEDFNKNLLEINKPIIIVDELDSTGNFKGGNPEFSVLFGLAENNVNRYEMTVGLVYKPVTGEFYFATTDSDATHQNKEGLQTKLSVSNRHHIITNASPVNVAINQKRFPERYQDCPTAHFEVIEAMQEFRNKNRDQVAKNLKLSAGLEIMDVARGKVDIYLCPNAGNWDYATGSLILRQAGGKTYLAKNLEMLINPTEWSLQLEKPGEYYPIIFTNGSIDQEFFKYMGEIIKK